MRAIFLSAAIILSLPLATQAEMIALPELFSVSNVAQNDMLNIRSEPLATGEIIGQFSPDATNIEVVAFSADGQWAQVNAGEIAGWVSRRFLELEGSAWKEQTLPEHLACYGTEPFWSLQQQDGKLSFSEPDNSDQALQLKTVLDRGFEGDRLRALLAADETTQMSAVIQPGLCSDGMSDRNFGLNATLILENKDQQPRLLSGCCSIAPRN